jgi:hypothetical protein
VTVVRAPEEAARSAAMRCTAAEGCGEAGARLPLTAYTGREPRYRALADTDPAKAERLAGLAQQAVDRQWDTYEQMATHGPARFPADARKAAVTNLSRR